jgi:hypothetical protein
MIECRNVTGVDVDVSYMKMVLLTFQRLLFLWSFNNNLAMKRVRTSSLIVLMTLIMLYSFLPPAKAQHTIGLVEYDSTNADGYVLFSPMLSRNTYLIDKCGKEINRWQSNYTPGASCYLLEDGSMIRAGNLRNPFFSGGGVSGILEHFNWDGSLRWSYRISSSTMVSHHDFTVMPNGNILVIVWQSKTRAQQIAAGRGPSLAENVIWSESILELQPVGTNSANIVWQWNLWDHLIQDSDMTKANYGVVADHPELVNLNYVRGNLPPADWIHLNAIDYNEELDQIVLSSYTFDEIWVIDHSTTTAEAATHSGGNSGKGGDLLYRWGNPEAYGRGEPTDKKLFHQHNPQWIPEGHPHAGKIIIFDNGDGRPGNQLYSSIVIIDPPINGDGSYSMNGSNSFGPADYFWEYTAPIKTELYSQLISGVQQLPNGSIMICEGGSGEFWEVDTTGKRVWKYINPISNTTPLRQGRTPSANSVFRCTYYPPSYRGFQGLTLTPGIEIESDPIYPALCEGRYITTLMQGGTYCVGSKLTAKYSANGLFYEDNTFYFELSDSNGSFSEPMIIDSLSATLATSFVVTLPSTIPASSKYRYRICSSNPAVIGTDNGVNISINALPIVTFNVPDTLRVCDLTQPVRVTATGGRSYRWDDGIDSASRLITTPGRYYITATNESLCETRDSIDVVVSETLDISIMPTKPTAFCDGSSVGLLANGADRYLWSTGDTTRLITVTSQGWYKVMGTSVSGCVGIDSIYVVVAPLPVITIAPEGSVSICHGDTVIVMATSAKNYFWSTGDTTQSIIVSKAGTYYVSTKNEEGCAGVSSTLIVKYLETPEKPTITRSGAMLTTNAAPPVQWYLNGEPITGATGSAYTPIADGDYTVLAKAKSGCSAISDAFGFVVLGVASEERNSAKVTITPNPFSDKITISIENNDQSSYLIECYSLLGEKVATIHSGVIPGGNQKLVHSFPQTTTEGTYFIRVQYGSRVETYKIVKD